MLSNKNISLVNSKVRKGQWDIFEHSGIVRTSSKGKLRICLVVKNFKILSESQSTCRAVGIGNNVLQIYHETRVAPREWKFEGILNQPEGIDLMLISRQSNPFNRLDTNFSIELDLLQVMLSNSNSSLIYKTPYSIHDLNLSVSEIQFRNPYFLLSPFSSDVESTFIQTGIGGWSFVTCDTFPARIVGCTHAHLCLPHRYPFRLDAEEISGLILFMVIRIEITSRGWRSYSWETGEKCRFSVDLRLLDHCLCISNKLLQWINDHWAECSTGCHDREYFQGSRL